MIENWEHKVNKIEPKAIGFEGDFTPFFAHDSILILEHTYDSLYSNKLKSLADQHERISTKIASVENELNDVTNPLMVEAIASRLKAMRVELEKIEKIQSIYQKTPEKTPLFEIKNSIDRLTLAKDSILGYTLSVTFVGKQGLLPEKKYHKNYLFNSEKNTVLGTLPK